MQIHGIINKCANIKGEGDFAFANIIYIVSTVFQAGLGFFFDYCFRTLMKSQNGPQDQLVPWKKIEGSEDDLKIPTQGYDSLIVFLNFGGCPRCFGSTVPLLHCGGWHHLHSVHGKSGYEPSFANDLDFHREKSRKGFEKSATKRTSISRPQISHV